MFVVYGTKGCNECVNVCQYLQRQGIEFEYIDVMLAEDLKVVVRSVPTIYQDDHKIGSFTELREFLKNWK